MWEDVKKDADLLLELIFKEQSSMTKEDSYNYLSDRYRQLEKLKISIRSATKKMEREQIG